MADANRQSVLFPELFDRPAIVRFDQPKVTSDGGALLLGQLDRSLGVSQALASCVRDFRDPAKVTHPIQDLLQHRIFGIACGYEDCNDVARLSRDELFTSLVGRDTTKGETLASQPTLSRFENGVNASDCLRMATELAELVFRRHQKRLGKRKVKRITIDFDGSVDHTHGMQQLSLFNGFYRSWCYFPLFCAVSFNDETTQYAFAAALRSGRATESVASHSILERVIPRLKRFFPKARILVRLDAGFKGSKLLELLEKHRVDYVIGLAGNAVLSRLSAAQMKETKRRARDTDETVTVFGETKYSAKSWSRERRVVSKCQIVRLSGLSPRENQRYVFTNLRHRPDRVFEIYQKRGDFENRIKELKDGLDVDRTSCKNFVANQFRLLLALAAYILFQEIHLRVARTRLANAQVWTLRDCLLKIGGIVSRSSRRIVVRLSESNPWADIWTKVARSCGATSIA